MTERAVLILPDMIKNEMKLFKIGESKLPDAHPLIKILSKLSTEEIDIIMNKDRTVVDILDKNNHSKNCRVKDIAMPIPINWLANDEGLE